MVDDSLMRKLSAKKLRERELFENAARYFASKKIVAEEEKEKKMFGYRFINRYYKGN
jgi:hypothetical protein